MKNFLIIIVLLVCTSARSQNLVENGSFETKTYCPTNYNQQQLKTIADWWQASDGTPDHFHACSKAVGVPKNVFGDQLAQDGESYAGVVTYSTGSTRNYREYLQTKLTRALTSGEMVCIEMYISAADFCSYVTDGVGLVLSKDRIENSTQAVIPMVTTLNNPHLNMLDETEGWVLLSDVYIAKGGEQYLTIGNFQMDRDMKVIRRTKDMGNKGSSTWAYVYVDNVSVKPVQQKAKCSCENEILASMVVDPPLELSEYNKIKLDAVLFDFDQDILTPDAIKQMEAVYALLKKNKAMYMEISGFTDIVGPDGYNLELSKRRAQKVIDHLKEKGISENRLNLTFFGRQNPVADNETEDGRHQNRRVEFQILEKKFELVQ